MTRLVITFPGSMPSSLAAVLRQELNRELEAIAVEVLATRRSSPTDRTRVAVVSPVSLYSALYGLTVGRPGPQASVRSVGDQILCYGADVATLCQRVAFACSPLFEWADDLQRRALETPGDVLVLGVAFTPQKSGAYELTIWRPSEAPHAAPEAP